MAAPTPLTTKCATSAHQGATTKTGQCKERGLSAGGPICVSGRPLSSVTQQVAFGWSYGWGWAVGMMILGEPATDSSEPEESPSGSDSDEEGGAETADDEDEEERDDAEGWEGEDECEPRDEGGGGGRIRGRMRTASRAMRGRSRHRSRKLVWWIATLPRRKCGRLVPTLTRHCRPPSEISTTGRLSDKSWAPMSQRRGATRGESAYIAI
ncbi:hypothetical protein BDK51DRAFT_29751 [Blyttiomyces helicus]|uniref:Uncharacterized protein n=1 Tax=Blyttiomyces helicus TaxID=388810 RepID=A0A4P9WQ43_9FUNG|nr:hypothetical protein BDK51DRAFT_29751 [Blyttiomyces helicus]|eukprot:RKO93330.1 hypothetical protein BDK51DRAFT_29751 [Blyttiomyces helicus]